MSINSNSIMKRIINVIKQPKRIVLFCNRNGFFNWLTDEAFLKFFFRFTMGVKLNLHTPSTFNEKLQWLKLYDRKAFYTELVDKYEVKQFVSTVDERIKVIPTLGVWDKFEDINFDKLPNQFVLKCTHDSGGLVIVRDKSNFDLQAAKKKINHSLRRNYYYSGREWAYKDVKPRIIAETYMEDNSELGGLTDYKFFCFNGIPKMIYASQGLENHATAQISFYDMQGKEMPFCRSDYKPIQTEWSLPDNFREMSEIAKKLASIVDSPFVRIDLYNIEGEIYFSEVTFSPCSGMLPFEPKEWDSKLGEWIQLPKKR